MTRTPTIVIVAVFDALSEGIAIVVAPALTHIFNAAFRTRGFWVQARGLTRRPTLAKLLIVAGAFSIGVPMALIKSRVSRVAALIPNLILIIIKI